MTYMTVFLYWFRQCSAIIYILIKQTIYNQHFCSLSMTQTVNWIT